ncbi:MAG: hypothetical protein AAF631_13600, partial [Pseudomonadota bacterium]
MDLILHIGTPKTGTTSIQGLLAKNRALLADRGVLVPKCFERRAMHEIAMAFRAPGWPNNEFAQGLGWGREEDRAPWQAAFRDRLSDELARSGAKTVIISSEFLVSRFMVAEEPAALAAWLRPRFDRITVLVYLRDPVRTFVSRMSTGLKVGDVVAMPAPGPVASARAWRAACINSLQGDAMRGDLAGDGPIYHWLDYGTVLEMWSDAFGRDAVVPVAFHRDHLEGGDAVTDFLARAGLDADGLTRHADRNATLSVEAAAVLMALNRAFPAFEEAQDPDAAAAPV